jgi:hypothetical protein
VYERDHFVTRADALRDVFRATLDKRVTHYAFFADAPGFVGIPVATTRKWAGFKDRDTQYVRTRGFLVEHRKSGRVYQVGLRHRMRARAPEERVVHVEYAGRARGRLRFDADVVITKEVRTLCRFLQRDPFLTGE